MVPTRHNVQELVKKIGDILYSLKLPSILDIDNLTHEIWLEAWLKGYPVTSTLIRHRAINYIRNLHNEVSVSSISDFLTREGTSSETEVKSRDSAEKVELFMKEAQLTNDQMQVITCIFWLKKTKSEIAYMLKWPQTKVEMIYSSALTRLQRAERMVQK